MFRIGIMRKHDQFERISHGEVKFGYPAQFIRYYPAPLDDSQQHEPERSSRAQTYDACL
jgi:hypothetical protein